MTTIVPLGDQAALCSFADETQALAFARHARAQSLVWLIDIVQAYKTVALFHDQSLSSFQQASRWASGVELGREQAIVQGDLHRIPCCYELGPDLERVAQHCKLAARDVIELHGSVEYTVYAIGFCPGFPFLGYLPTELEGVPRLPSPRLRVEAGSVGLTGRQTGIYTEPRPGGWNLIGQTPLKLVDVAEGFFPLRTGDRVQFFAIGMKEFERLRGQRYAASGN